MSRNQKIKKLGPRELIEFLSEEWKKTAENEKAREDFDGLLSVVTDQLYSKGSRLLLELLQNADDNDYSNGKTPKVDIRYQRELLAFVNNEIGFSNQNVDALCRVTQSTKRKLKSKKTGEKGIGFKSVFQI